MKVSTAKWIVCIVMGVLVVGGMAIPAIKNVTDPDKTYTNRGMGYSLTDEGTHVLTLSAGESGFDLDTDGGISSFNDFFFYAPGGKGIAAAVGLGVYEAYNKDGVLVSQPNVTPTTNQTMAVYRTQVLVNNQDNDESVYQIWNYYNYSLYKLMATTIMGNSDSQYMMGMGKVSGDGPNMTGLTDSAYSPALSDTSSVCLLLENVWGSVWDTVGETYVDERVIAAGNTLGGTPIDSNMNNTIEETLMVPSTISRGYVKTISYASDVWGTALTAQTNSATDPGTSINDCVWTNNAAGLKVVQVGGIWRDADRAGLYAIQTTNATSFSSVQSGTRISCYMDDNILPGKDFGYILTTDNGGVVSSVRFLENGSLVDVMPDGTDLNTHWDFDRSTGLGPFNVYYAAVNLSDGPGADDDGQSRLSQKKGEIAYILDPYDLSRTLDGYRFDSTQYNVLLIIPTFYWYSDQDTGSVYMGSSPDMFEGISMTAYGHEYTKGASMGNIGFSSVREFAYGDGLIVSISDIGEVTVMDGISSVVVGTVGWDSPLQITISGDTFSCNGTDYQGLWAYADRNGDHVLTDKGKVTGDSVIVIGGYGDTVTMSDVPVSIGYVLKGTVGTVEDVSVVLPVASSITTDPASATAEILSSPQGRLTLIQGTECRSVWSDGSGSTSEIVGAIVPRTVTYHNDMSDDKMTGTMLKLIPLLVLLAILGTMAYYTLGRRGY